MNVGRRTGRGGPGSLRIIGGEWRGRRLKFPSRAMLRPTPDRVRETLFNWLAAVLPGSRCLDLFAGTGCLGLEALSRGAAEAWLVERDPVLAQLLAEHALKLGANARVVREDARRFLARHGRGALAPEGPDRDARSAAAGHLATKPFDVVFLDPPYRDPVEPLLDALDAVLAPDALIYVERPQPPGLTDSPFGDWVKRARAGGIEFGLLQYPNRTAATIRPVSDGRARE